MMKKTPAAAIAALGLGVVLAAAACSSGGGSSNGGNSSSSTGPVTLTFWTNATPGPGLTFFQNAVKSFDAAHPGAGGGRDVWAAIHHLRHSGQRNACLGCDGGERGLPHDLTFRVNRETSR